MRFSGASVLALAPLAFAITPQQMLGAPRRSDASPNPSGEWAVYSETTYDWEEHAASSVFKLLNVKSGDITTLYNGSDINELFWIGPKDTSILYINGTNEEVPGGVTLYLTDATSFSSAVPVASLPAPFQGLKAQKTSSGDINFVVNTLAYRNGSAYNPESVTEPPSTARIYTDIYVRHWDTWLTPERYNIWSGVLKAGSNSTYGNSSSSYTFDGELTNLLLKGFDGAITRPETPWQPFGDQGDYDISPDGSKVAFLTKAPEVAKANYTASYIYVVPFDGSAAAEAVNSPEKAPENARGASASPRWSPDGKYLAYFQIDSDIYESGKAKIYVASSGGNSTGSIKTLAENWDRSGALLSWNPKTGDLIVGAADLGTENLFVVPVDADADYKPKNITGGAKSGIVANFYVFPDGTSLVSDSSLVSSRNIYTVSADGSDKKVLFASNKVDSALSGLSDDDYDQFYYPGNWTDIQAWIVYPEGFDKSKKYPLAYLIHGGPQGAWGNSWSTRWNPKVWADQGYVVVTPNPTGSTGFGQELTDKIQNNWGSYPYDDLVKGFEHLQGGDFPFIDTENAIAGGASYGGFMTNWIQGNDLGRKFKALVTHDGSTSTLNQYATEELWFMQHDFNGTLWEDRVNYEVWDPISRAAEFATPHFVVHNTKDYRLPESEGIMLFNVLQERGVPSRFLSFPDENHWVLNRENSLVWHTEIYNWINGYTGLDVKQAIDTEQYVGSG